MKQPSLEDALYLVDAHGKTGCIGYAVDYAERTKHLDRDRMQRGWAYIEAGLKRRAELNREAS